MVKTVVETEMLSITKH